MVQVALAYAKPIVRGGPAADGALAAGAFYRPALLEVEDVNSDIVQKEVFGPVATFEVFDTETDAIALANATEYGLAAGIFTTSINISRRVSREIHAGTGTVPVPACRTHPNDCAAGRRKEHQMNSDNSSWLQAEVS